MIQVHPQYVIDEFQKKKAVLLTFEELEEIQLYDIAKTGGQETIPFEQAVQEIEDEYEY